MVVGLVSVGLRSWGDVCWCIFLVTWDLRMLLRVVDLIFVGVNIGASWVDWWSFVTSFWPSVFVQRLLSWWMCLMAWWQSGRWQVLVSLLTLVVGSWRRDLWTISDSRWNPEVSLALESGLRSSLVPLSDFGEVNGLIFDLIFSNCWEISTVEVLDSLWCGVGKNMQVLEVELALEVRWGVDVHAVWSLEWSMLILGLWESFCDLA